ncbi:MAG: hypothetical protein J5780_01950 [Treponema sp.]|nr:hypothetical protein [Treponema sp.]
MYAFLLLALPALIIRYCFTDRTFSSKQFIPPVLTGLFLGIFLCMAREFFFVSSSLTVNSLPVYFFNDMLSYSVLPSAAVLLIFNLISRDRAEYKAASVFPLEASFYAVLLPFTVISSDEKTSFFLNIILPVLTAAALFAQSAFVTLSAKNALKKSTSVILKAAAVLVPAVIPFVKQIWFFGGSIILYLACTVIVTVLSLLLFAFAQKERADS